MNGHIQVYEEHEELEYSWEGYFCCLKVAVRS